MNYLDKYPKYASFHTMFLDCGQVPRLDALPRDAVDGGLPARCDAQLQPLARLLGSLSISIPTPVIIQQPLLSSTERVNQTEYLVRFVY